LVQRLEQRRLVLEVQAELLHLDLLVLLEQERRALELLALVLIVSLQQLHE
jgi:hypothetical protein